MIDQTDIHLCPDCTARGVVTGLCLTCYGDPYDYALEVHQSRLAGDWTGFAADTAE